LRSATGSGRRAVHQREDAVFAPMPSASDRTATQQRRERRRARGRRDGLLHFQFRVLIPSPNP
jgi:hypothetical protein